LWDFWAHHYLGVTAPLIGAISVYGSILRSRHGALRGVGATVTLGLCRTRSLQPRVGDLLARGNQALHVLLLPPILFFAVHGGVR